MLLSLSSALLTTIAFAASGDFMGDLMGPPGQNPGVRVRHEFRHYGDAGANGESFRLQQNKFDISAPVMKTEESNWRAHAGADYDAVKTNAVFPNGKRLPNHLWDIGAGVTHSRTLLSGNTVGGNFSMGSASDRPFGAARDMGFSLNVTYKVPYENEAAWIFFLSVSNTRGFLNYIPLPGVAYSFKAGERTRMVLGIPFVMIFWRPFDPWSVSFMYFPIRTAELKIAYGSPRGPQPYALAAFKSRNFRLYGRSDGEEKLFHDEGLLQAGIGTPISRTLALDLSGGVSFARSYFLAKKLTERSTAPRIRMENAAFGQLKVTANF